MIKNPYQILKRPLITEKGMDTREKARTLIMQVDSHANKCEVKWAVEQAFKVKVESVHTANFQGKMRRRGRNTGFRLDWKKAYIKLKQGEKIPEFLENA
ncbi:MAG: 50S ribosomal protein L23 [Terriglobia bacterium]